MITPVNPNAVLSVQTQKALRASDPEAWAMVKKGLAPKKDLSSVSTLAPGTLVSLETQTSGDKTVRPVLVQENTALSVQTKRAIRASDPESWAMVKKGLVPSAKELPDAVEEPQPSFQQAIDAYTSNSIAQDADALLDMEELFK